MRPERAAPRARCSLRWQRWLVGITPRSMSENLIIGDGVVVTLNYTLRTDDGALIDSSTADDPLAYLHGADNIVPGLEQALAGKTVGFSGKVTVEPEDGYGEREDLPPQAVPRSAFPADARIAAGMQFMAEGPNGEHAPIWIAGVEGDQVLVDSQHPLAGKTLNFEVEVLAVRSATADELSHGHPHGPDGHGHHH
jgi:FKBP-type peptidyl-prolyl cis-trans isomerase SlyD